MKKLCLLLAISIMLYLSNHLIYRKQVNNTINSFKMFKVDNILKQENTFGNVNNHKNYTFISILCKDNQMDKMSINHEQMRHLSVMLKSAAMLTRRYIRFYLITNSVSVKDNIETMITKWPQEYKSRLLLSYHKPFFPLGYEKMKKQWAPFSSIRLFIPDIFPDLDAAIYLDTDIIFLGSPDELWDEFNNFNDVQLAAVAPTNQFRHPNYKFPYYPPGGLGTAVIMMNLTRMRMVRQYKQYNLSTQLEATWSVAIMRMYDAHKDRLLTDMGLVNYLFGQNPDLLYLLGCWWNFHLRWCKVTEPCVTHMASENQGVSVLHGAGNTFMKNQVKMFKVVFRAFENHTIGSSDNMFLTSLEHSLNASLKSSSSICDNLDNIDDLLSKELKKHIGKI